MCTLVLVVATFSLTLLLACDFINFVHVLIICLRRSVDESEGTGSGPDIDEDSVGEPGSDDDLPSDDEPSEAGKKGAKSKSGFVLPVKVANKAAKSDNGSVSSASNAGGVNLDSLSSGLMVKQPPKLLSKPKTSDTAAPTAPAPPRAVVPKAASATGTRESATKAPASAALASATAHAAPAETSAASVSTATGTAASVPVIGGSTVTAATAGTVATAADLVLRDPEVVRAEALANVSPCHFPLSPSTEAVRRG
jgi:hypothetical protein